ncbi:plasma-membrane proton-efflux P-type ATPase [Chitinophaga polysaccharea]|uniref:plasma-membrane proton-efflux P-type ATPase n=1 Tax=Chitinophaga TaxID=79328 RepID=UPI00145568A5|nr:MULTISPECIES: plasma-membrane proton-efflux P-type ATPase [Chitinophaga]NLR60486.1 plasma-membrane proton-efflux P-type ATPase [Chitinophaga polysaccharea]NLU90402.1 plasma-membrane proton-efflux P-type ATPase [Chitinophaga sp. Ak27]
MIDLYSGLPQREAESRLRQYGYNEVPEKKTYPLVEFLSKFWGLSAWMLELIIILSWILHKASDAYIVAGLLVFNAIIGFLQEQHAANAVDALKKNLQVMVRVIRDGTWQTFPARQIVPGDILRIRTGDFIPADVEIVHGEIHVDQSALTGESVEIRKALKAAVFSGSIVTGGEATAAVTATGSNTSYGKTIELVKIARPQSHIDTLISKVVKWLLLIVTMLLLIALITSILKGSNLLEILPLMLVLLLGAIPVALSAMFTVSMALGSRQLVKEGVLITRLNAPDDAAAMDILCVDKTGTLTENKLSVAKIIPAGPYTENDVLLYGALASQEANHDSIDIAFIDAANQKNLINSSFIQEAFTPFDPQTRRTKAIIKKGDEKIEVMKGAFGSIAQTCGLDEKSLRDWEIKINGLAEEGYRAIAIAERDLNDKPHLIGVVGLHDPPRSDAKKLIDEIENLGISVKMLTGDALPVAVEIAKAVGIAGTIIKASELKTTDKAKKTRLLQNFSGAAEVYPADKYGIVKSFQEAGHIVGMTGDGVNDAPALKQAEVGIAVSNATDVAKGAASIVLTEEGLANIISPVKIGRMMFERINTWILNKIARTILKTCFVVFSFLFLGKYVISASAMLLMIFMTDFVKISLSTDNVRWSVTPAKWHINKLAKTGLIIGLLMTLEAFGLLYISQQYFGLYADDAALNTFCFEILLFFALFSIFIVREQRHFWCSKPSKILLFIILADMIFAIMLSTFGFLGFKAIPITQTLFVIIYTLFFSLGINDVIKVAFFKRVEKVVKY